LTEIRAKGLPLDLAKGLFEFTSHVFYSHAHDQRLENVSDENLAKRVHTLFMFDEHGRMHPEITDFTPERQAAMGPREEKINEYGEELDTLDMMPVPPDATGPAVDRERLKREKVMSLRQRLLEKDAKEKMAQEKALAAVATLLSAEYRASNTEVNALLNEKNAPGIMTFLRTQYSVVGNSQLRNAGLILDYLSTEIQPPHLSVVQLLPRLKVWLGFLHSIIPGRLKISEDTLMDALRAGLHPIAAYAAVVMEARPGSIRPDTAQKMAVSLDMEIATEIRLAEARAILEAKSNTAKLNVRALQAEMDTDTKAPAKTNAQVKAATTKAAAKAKVAKDAAAKALAPADGRAMAR
jgi:hypothetical protein